MSLPWESKGNYSAGIPVDVMETAFEHCWEKITSEFLRLRVGTCLQRTVCMSLTAQQRFFVAMAHVVDSANETVLGAFLLVSLNQPLITAARRILRHVWGSMLPFVYWTICVCLWQHREVVAFGALFRFRLYFRDCFLCLVRIRCDCGSWLTRAVDWTQHDSHNSCGAWSTLVIVF